MLHQGVLTRISVLLFNCHFWQFWQFWQFRYAACITVEEGGGLMIRERALKIALVVVGLFFTLAAYPAIGGLRNPANSDTGDTMQMAIYATLGIFLLLAVRNPSAHRSLIAFAAWSSFAHAAVMGTLGFEIAEQRTGFLIASAILVVIGLVLIVLAPPKQAARASPTSF